jgi:hypothetical protein
MFDKAKLPPAPPPTPFHGQLNQSGNNFTFYLKRTGTGGEIRIKPPFDHVIRRKIVRKNNATGTQNGIEYKRNFGFDRWFTTKTHPQADMKSSVGDKREDQILLLFLLLLLFTVRFIYRSYQYFKICRKSR